ncbi:helix-turn-helix transcriptional regulator [Mangrovibacterium diazotrophicum]|uniref:Putative DNA-binding transcriptional regulator YafY n=1 Tax=Mangrovibacterium diazotrophicum TaxID=1261403 RepID=A0A419W3X5_9BACT|nr:WYL domain-containing protein [Mangrovibacterium diazotrophicum]RKD90040.1 putative DNA-binding transcriptional regulator YafY [Mangrovibacterium diazotrophicum]
MSTNKNATIRYQALDRCFRNPGRKYYIEDLIDACNDALLDVDPKSSGVKRRQVYEDIKFMQDSKGFDAPIESFKDGRKAFYRYTDLSFSINSQPLNEQEAQQLKESLLTLSRFKGMPQFDWVEELTARLEQTFNLKTDDNILSFEENPFLTGREYIGDIYNAIVSKKVLLITYKPFKTERELLFEIHPYHLKQYNNRWFLFGLNNEYGSITNLALDRIQEINESKTKYIANTKIDFSDYFDDVIGVSVDDAQEPQKVVLKADDDLLPYITSKPIHGSQKIKKDEDGTRIELKLQLNYELESTIFSFGEKIEVLEPEALRAAITNRIKVLNQKYSTCV